MRIPVIDSENSDMSAYFDEAMKFIEDGVNTHFGVLVHCQQGVSRSSTITIAYLMKHKKMTLQQAYMHLKKVRPICKPKKNFLRQLIKYEKRLRSEESFEEKSDSLKSSTASKKRPLADISPSPSPSPEDDSSQTSSSTSDCSDKDKQNESGNGSDAPPSSHSKKKRVVGPTLPPDVASEGDGDSSLSNVPKKPRVEKDTDESMSAAPSRDLSSSNSSEKQLSETTPAEKSNAKALSAQDAPKRKVYGVSLPPDLM